MKKDPNLTELTIHALAACMSRVTLCLMSLLSGTGEQRKMEMTETTLFRSRLRSSPPLSTSKSISSIRQSQSGVGALDSPGAMQEATPSPPPTPPSMHLASPPSRESDLDHDHDDASLRFRGVDNILGPVGVSSLAQRALQQELHAVNTEDPNSFVEAVNSLSWRAAMVEELKSIKDNKTWDVIDLPHGHRAIGLKWVFKAKKDEQGRVVKHKARLVAKGFVQKPAIDYEEAFAPVARTESVRLILAVAMHEGWHVHHMDVKSAFLNDKLDEVVYV
jgi:hypothetical protein